MKINVLTIVLTIGLFLFGGLIVFQNKVMNQQDELIKGLWTDCLILNEVNAHFQGVLIELDTLGVFDHIEGIENGDYWDPPYETDRVLNPEKYTG